MSDQDNLEANKDQDKANGRPPDHIAYHVSQSRDGKAYFNRVGVAFEHKDQRGFDVHLDSTPVNGKVTLRALRQEKMQGYREQAQQQTQRQNQDQQHQQTETHGQSQSHQTSNQQQSASCQPEQGGGSHER